MSSSKKFLLAVTSVMVLGACSNIKNVDNSWCPPEAAPVVAPQPQMERVELSADALFKFDRSSIADLLPEGRRTLDDLVQKITTGYVSVDQIHLTGHTDRLGSEAYNQKLGLARAQTVRDYLANNGISARMSVASEGERQPVTKDCVGNKATPSLIRCLQPDRRVVIDILGVKKGR